MKEQDHDYLEMAEVAAHYRTTEATVRYWRHTAYGPKGVRVGRRVLYPRAEVERFDRQLAAESGAATSAPDSERRTRRVAATTA